MFRRSTHTTKLARPGLRLEALEAREVPAVLIQIDYSRDIVRVLQQRRGPRHVEQVATRAGQQPDREPRGHRTGRRQHLDRDVLRPGHRRTGVDLEHVDRGEHDQGVRRRGTLSGSEAGFGGFGGYSISGTQAWLNTVEYAGHSGFAPWGGSITFDSDQNWHFGSSTAGLDSNELDFYSVAVHELGHVLGIGTAPQWENQVSGGAFRGGNATSVYGGAVPVTGGRRPLGQRDHDQRPGGEPRPVAPLRAAGGVHVAGLRGPERSGLEHRRVGAGGTGRPRRGPSARGDAGAVCRHRRVRSVSTRSSTGW